MSTAGKQVVRMGPITILSMLIVLSLATMAVLSFTTARAAQRTADKQAQALEAAYECEASGQQFVAQVDEFLYRHEAGTAPRQAAEELRQATQAQGQGNLVSKTFEAQGRQLHVSVRVEEGLRYTVVEWRTQAVIDSQEPLALWQG